MIDQKDINHKVLSISGVRAYPPPVSGACDSATPYFQQSLVCWTAV